VELEGYIHGNALELLKYDLGKIDVILLMGPLYHLLKYEDREKVVKDSCSLLKPGGILIASFISSYAPMVDMLKHDPSEVDSTDDLLRYINNGVNKSEDGFTTAYFMTPSEIKSFINKFKLKELVFAGMEGYSSLVEEKINGLPKEKFQKWIDIIYKLSEDPQTFACCEHYLYVGKMKNLS